MLTVCWSCKGGVGTTVIAALLALRSAEHTSTVAVGLDADLTAALGVAVSADDTGFTDWVRAAAEAPSDALERLGLEAKPGLVVVPAGIDAEITHEDVTAAITVMRQGAVAMVVDAGRVDRSEMAGQLAAAADVSLLVTRRCYLGLRRCSDLPVQPTGVVVVSERGRALTLADVESVVGAPVVADVAVDDSVARSIDAGLLTSRLPRGVLGSLARVL